MADPDTLGSIGELATLARIFPRLPSAASAIVGPGDDCAVVAAPDGRFVVTTDMMIHGPDFRLAWSTPHDLGFKAAATNLSDVAAMGARPTALVVAIAAPESTPVALLEGIASGLADGCSALAPGCGVVGGDLSVSSTLTIAVTAFGDLEGRAPVLRSGARVGDVVAVSGALGLAGRGLALLFSQGVTDASSRAVRSGRADGVPRSSAGDPGADGADGAGEGAGADDAVSAGEAASVDSAVSAAATGTTRGGPDADAAADVRARHPQLIEAQLAPRPPIADGPAAAIAGATSMIDLSDGLALDASRVARASGVRISLESALLGDEPGWALSGGEDHSLLATFPPQAVLPGGFHRIGRVEEGEGLAVDGAPWDGRSGWDPYRGWDGGAG